MGRLIDGMMIILFLLIIGFLITFVRAGTTNDNNFVKCSGTDNATQCENVGKTSFFSAVRDVAVGDFGDDTPTWISGLWLLAAGVLLSTAILLVVLAFIPLTSE